MKPKNRIFCPDCGKPKMLFESEQKAQNFLRWNSDDIHNGGKLHPYYCKACGGWHLSHVEHKDFYDDRIDERINMYRETKAGKRWQRKIERLKRGPQQEHPGYQRKMNKESLLLLDGGIARKKKR